MSIFSNISGVLLKLKKRSKRKNIDFDLDKKWLEQKLNSGRCEATGIKFNLDLDPYINPYYPSIDRVDSYKGYTKDNCQLVCHMYNIAKAESTTKIFAYWAKEYVKNYEESNNETN